VNVSVPKETASGERRVALVPEVVERLAKADIEVVVEAGAGESASHPDSA
jgi:H+-translocating NAD(P) transhydrogenase subunit alpha